MHRFIQILLLGLCVLSIMHARAAIAWIGNDTLGIVRFDAAGSPRD